jgi:hypothetical protein
VKGWQYSDQHASKQCMPLHADVVTYCGSRMVDVGYLPAGESDEGPYTRIYICNMVLKQSELTLVLIY